MQFLEDDLNDKVDQTIQDALANVETADIEDMDEDQLEDLRVKVLTQLDRDIAGVTDANIRQRQFLIEQFEQVAQDRQARLANANTINQDMSVARGYYVDGNGDPLVAEDGQRIKIPAEAPIPPQFDKSTGILTTFRTDPATGRIMADVTKTLPDVTTDEKVINSYADLINQGKIGFKEVPEELQDSVAVASSIERPELPEGEQIIIERGQDNPYL